MALPVGITTCIVTFGNDYDFIGTGLSATITATPTHDVVWTATGQRLVSFPLTATVAAGVAGSIVLPVVDQAGFTDGNGNAFTLWAYSISVLYTSAAGSSMVTKAVQPLTGQASIDFDALVSGPVVAAVSAPVATVTSVNGQTGAVVVAGSGTGTVTSVTAGDSTVTIGGVAGVSPTVRVTEPYTAAERTKLSGVATGATANSSDAVLLARANHTGTESADVLTDGTTNKAFLATERTKLTGVATGATANSSDATLLARANHTGTESADVLTDGVTNKAFLATERTKLAAITGTNTGDQTVTLTGDVTGSGTGSFATALAAAGTAGTYGDATHVPQFTTDTKGRVTAVTAVPISAGGSGPVYAKTFTSGYWSTLLPTSGVGGGGQNIVPAISQICTYPFIVGRSLTFNGMGVYVYGTAVTGATLRLGFYTDNNGAPGTLIVDFGTLAMSPNGIQSAVISQAMTAGVYWLAYVQQGGASPSLTYTGNMVSLLGDGRDVQSAVSFDDSFMVSSASTYTGALPGTFPALSTVVWPGAPRIVFKAA